MKWFMVLVLVCITLNMAATFGPLPWGKAEWAILVHFVCWILLAAVACWETDKEKEETENQKYIRVKLTGTPKNPWWKRLLGAPKYKKPVDKQKR